MRTRARPPWWASLQVQLVAVACLLLVTLVAAAVWLSDQLVGSELLAEAESGARARASATATGLNRQLADAARIGEPLIVAFESDPRSVDSLASLGQGLLERAYHRTNGLVVGLGLWPAAGAVAPRPDPGGVAGGAHPPGGGPPGASNPPDP
ncbi:MAG: hypothetical protein VX549_09310, partial [Pseudomonadota bacterium]|nr:hypothetical protein [Pseudomonadota bacterium]